MTSHVYILAHREAPRFKIGKANNILGRARTIGIKEFDLPRSIGLRVESPAAASNLERMLHRAFAAWRLPASEVEANGGTKDGASEWFRAECFDRVRAFVDGNRDLFGASEIPVAPPARKRRRATPALATERHDALAAPVLQSWSQVENQERLEAGDPDAWRRIVGASAVVDDRGHFLLKGKTSDVLEAIGEPVSAEREAWLLDLVARLRTVRYTESVRTRLGVGSWMAALVTDFYANDKDGTIFIWSASRPGMFEALRVAAEDAERTAQRHA